ncbi:hypothetical protein [Bifidobacterium gallicum]|uniref:Uncharacterized protein n=1 Tax=Bifidobacterium gallicum DSM 20093 = LMG 11596 TaxID=561180 RepID=D1NU60_9BIFI|nr:hypothetical protein [Bifidobacterium gallicum]EFA23264.1 hypothetical protein BIFGAL_03381 [Bifidobacterium gallicum DSM 20093 = LMG 11596]KFI58913.1 hypothetical protein BGLCM_1210 [Bifidobacterium gallicum DSM 20093 = LMG 11596]
MAIEIGAVDATTMLEPQTLVDAYTERVASNYGGYFPDTRGVGLLGADFVKLAAEQIRSQVADGESVDFARDSSDDVVANMREALKIASYRRPLLAIARYIVSDWITFQFVDLEQAESVAADPTKAAIATLFKAYMEAAFAPANDDEEAALNTAAYLPEGDQIADIVNTIDEMNIEHLSGKHVQDGGFLVYDGTKYADPLQDPNMMLFE